MPRSKAPKKRVKGIKRHYSVKTARHATQLQGVHERRATRDGVGPDICFDISYKFAGRKVWEKVGWRSEGYSPELARDVRNARIKALRHGEELPKQKAKAPTFKVLAERYLAWSAENKNRHGIEDKSRYENHLAPRFDDKRLDGITPFDLERMKADMAKAGMAPKTIGHCLALLRAMFNRAADWEMYQGSNPVRKVKMPVVQNARDRFLSVEEANRLLTELKRDPHHKNGYRALKDPKLHDVTLLSLHTGARAGEIFDLKVQDIDFNTGLLALRDTKNTETRYAPMTAAVRDILKRRLPTEPNTYVFTDAKGRKIKEVSNAFERAVGRLGFNVGVTDPRQLVVFHTCRHSFASWLAIQGIPLLTIARLMGHKSISMSERYAHLSPDHKRDAITGLEAALNGHGKVVRIEKARG